MQTMIKFMSYAKKEWKNGFKKAAAVEDEMSEVPASANKDLRNTVWKLFVTNMIQPPLLTWEEVDNHLAWELHEANQQAGPDIRPHTFRR